MKNQTYYDILRVGRNCSPEALDAAYENLRDAIHLNPNFGEPYELQLVREAYETLIDPVRRLRYDTALQSQPAFSGAERRRSERQDWTGSISYCINQDHRWLNGRVEDISAIGVKLVAGEPIGKNQRVVIVCPNPAASAVQGRVSWSRLKEPLNQDLQYEAGVEFDVIVDDIQRRFDF